MTELLETYLQNNNLHDPEDMDALLEAAALARQLLDGGDTAALCTMIRYTVERGYYEAFSWLMEIVQEAFDKGAAQGLDGTACELGGLIPDYKEFIRRLQADLRVQSNDVEKIPDEYGEVQSFFNIFTYQTGYPNISLMTAENFDTKDNDFIQYKLVFARN